MEESTKYPTLEDLWFEKNPDALVCCSCQSKIGSGTLIRTFRLFSPGSGSAPSGYTKIVPTPFERHIILYDRHLQCLLRSGVRHAAISHVWDPTISRTQRLGRLEKPHPDEARRLAIRQPLLIYRSLVKSGEISDHDEIWHDYISVPQWTDQLKDKILLTISDIYRSAHVTAIHFGDLQKESIRMLYHGQTTEELLKGITDICSAEWFTRVWTAMEFVRSSHLVGIDAQLDVCSYVEDPLFLNRMLRVWVDLLLKHESVHHLEAAAGIGQNLVPWNLGPLTNICGGKSSIFGQAFALLSRRRCQSNHDFVHALLGLVRPVLDRPLERNFDREITRIAKLCLAAGDYTPILLTPRLGEKDRAFEDKEGFSDLSIWPLGAETQPPDLHQDFSFESGDLEADPIFKVERIGVVSSFHKTERLDLIIDFAKEVSIVLKATGPDLESFIDTLGSRLYYGKSDLIKQRLISNGDWDKLLIVLRSKHEAQIGDSWPIEGPNGASWLAEAMTLSLKDPWNISSEPMSRIDYCNAHGSTVHVGHAHFNYTLSILCASCRRTHVFRAGLFELPDSSREYVAYRIPGLGYQFSHPNGVGFITTDGRVVGRMAWATPACERSPVEKVKVKMPTMPAPKPRPYT